MVPFRPNLEVAGWEGQADREATPTFIDRFNIHIASGNLHWR